MSPAPHFATSDEQIAACLDTLLALRPHLKSDQLVPAIRRQQAQGYRLLALQVDGRVVSVAGFRCHECLAWGSILYIDDLSTLPAARGKGHAGILLDWLIAEARRLGCDEVHLDSGYARHDAHRLYLNKGFRIASHHFALSLR